MFFPSYQIPGIDGDVIPKLMTFHLAGPAVIPPVANGKTEHTSVDGPMEYPREFPSPSSLFLPGPGGGARSEVSRRGFCGAQFRS